MIQVFTVHLSVCLFQNFPENDPFMFRISDLQKTASTADEIVCPQHSGEVLLTELVSILFCLTSIVVGSSTIDRTLTIQRTNER